MDTKLTIKLNKMVIDKAKVYASLHQRSLSRLIESYLKSLIDQEVKPIDNEIEISPFVKSLRTGVKLPADLSSKGEYGKYIEEKYK